MLAGELWLMPIRRSCRRSAIRFVCSLFGLDRSRRLLRGGLVLLLWWWLLGRLALLLGLLLRLHPCLILCLPCTAVLVGWDLIDGLHRLDVRAEAGLLLLLL